MRLCTTTIAVLFILSSTIIADDGYFGGAGANVMPEYNSDIEMLAEVVDARKVLDGWKVECTFIFQNTGDACEVQMGFPDYPKENGEGTGESTIQNFSVRVDGIPISFDIKRGIQSEIKEVGHYDRVFIFFVKFQKDEIRIVQNSYSFGFSGTSDGIMSFKYVLKTGRLWKNTIGKAIISVDLSDVFGIEKHLTKPQGFEIKGDKIVWKFKNLEPTEDILLLYQTQNLYQAEEMLNEFMAARLRRNQPLSESFLTDTAKRQYSLPLLTLVGTSNPHFAKYEIISKKIDEDSSDNAFSAIFIVRIYEEFTGEGIVGYFDETLVIRKTDDSSFKVNSVVMGKHVDLQTQPDYKNKEIGK